MRAKGKLRLTPAEKQAMAENAPASVAPPTHREIMAARMQARRQMCVSESWGRDICYGAPITNDPREFSPSIDENTDEELVAWARDYARVIAGDDIEWPGHRWVNTGDGVSIHLSMTRWGMGVTHCRDLWVDDEEGEA